MLTVSAWAPKVFAEWVKEMWLLLEINGNPARWLSQVGRRRVGPARTNARLSAHRDALAPQTLRRGLPPLPASLSLLIDVGAVAGSPRTTAVRRQA